MIKKAIECIEKLPIFDDLRGTELNLIASYMELVTCEKDDVIFREGDPGDAVFFIIEGILDVVKDKAKDKNVIIAEFSKGRSVGEMSLIDDFPRSATVKVRTDGQLVKLTKQGFESILKEHPGTGIKILKGLARLLSLNLRRTSGHLADIAPHFC
jgi:CRP/FNR family cyclic AMP-dependent transcriptional regulator